MHHFSSTVLFVLLPLYTVQMEDLYSVLECSANAPQTEIKQNYQRLVLTYHPDKLCDIEDADVLRQYGNKFQQVQRAYKILGDAAMRAEYDARWQQRCLAQDWPIQDDIDINDFEVLEDDYVTSCRCGGEYRLSQTDVDVYMDFVQCSNCSLCIRILYESNYEFTESHGESLDHLCGEKILPT